MSILKNTIIKALVAVFTVVLLLNVAELESKPKKSKATKYYKDKNITKFAQRVNVNEIVKLRAIKLKLFADSANTSFRLRLFGNEGGNIFPNYEHDIIKPIELHKDSVGIEEITVRIDEDVQIDYNQFFICLDSMSENLYWMSDEKEKVPQCKSESGTYYRQLLKMKSGNWLNGKYSYAFTCVYDTLRLDKSNYFKRTEIPDIVANDTLKNGNVSIFDYNEDKKIDVLVDNKLYTNLGNYQFQENTSFNSLGIVSPITIALDLNNDGINEAVFIGEKDTASGIYINSIYKCATNDFAYISSFAIDSLDNPIDFIVEDLNNDGYKDIIIIQPDSSNLQYILLRNNKGKLEQDYGTIHQYIKDYKQIRNLFVIDINYDNLKDIVFVDNSGSLHYIINQGDFIFNKYKYNELNIKSTDNIIEKILPMDYNNGIKKEFLLLEQIDNIRNKEELPDIAYLLNNRENTQSGLFETSKIDEKVSRASISDINNDGLKDILLFTADGCHRSYLLLNTESGKFKNIGIYSGFYSNYFPNDILMADMNSDGKIDILTYEAGKIVIYNNTYDNCEPTNNYFRVLDKTNQVCEIGIKSKGTTYTYHQDIQRSSKMLFSGEIIVGLANNPQIDTVEVSFGSGYTNQYGNIESNELVVERIDKTNNKKEIEIELRPNPFKDNLEVSINISCSSEIGIKVLGLSGEERYSEIITAKAGSNVYKWNCKDKSNNLIENGMYVIEITVNNKKYLNKIIKID